MGQVLEFRLRAAQHDGAGEAALDLLSAVDFALRDLADIASQSTLASIREQAISCRLMLEKAYEAELGLIRV